MARGKSKGAGTGSGTSPGSDAISLSFKFGKATDIGYGGKDRLPVTIKLIGRNKPLPDLKVKLTAGPDEVIDPAPECFTNEKGEALFIPTIPNGEPSVEVLATVFFLNGEKRQYAALWERSEEEKPVIPDEIEVEEGGLDGNKSCYRIKFLPNAEVKIRAARNVFWCNGGDPDCNKSRFDHITLDDEGEAEISVISGDAEGMMISFHSGKVSSDEYWLYGSGELGHDLATGPGAP